MWLADGGTGGWCGLVFLPGSDVGVGYDTLVCFRRRCVSNGFGVLGSGPLAGVVIPRGEDAFALHEAERVSGECGAAHSAC